MIQLNKTHRYLAQISVLTHDCCDRCGKIVKINKLSKQFGRNLCISCHYEWNSIHYKNFGNAEIVSLGALSVEKTLFDEFMNKRDSKEHFIFR